MPFGTDVGKELSLTEYSRKLSATNIKYMLAIHDLLSKGVKHVRSIDLAKLLSVTKPSVHSMLNSLQEMNLITKERNGIITFTSEGKELADKYKEFYEAWNLYLDRDISDSENRRAAVCAVLAELSEEENRRIKEVKKHEETVRS